MTYRELSQELAKLNPEQMGADVTVSLDLSEEAIPVTYFITVQKDDMLDGVLGIGHPVLAVNY